MLAKAEAAAGVAQRWFLMTLAVAGALGIAGLGLAIALAGTMVRPVHALTAATARIASGDLDAQAEVLSHDEIGLLATEFNRMAEHIRHVRRSDVGKVLVAQQTTEAIIASLYDPVLVTDAQGGVTKLNPAAEQLFGPEAQHRGKPVAEMAHDSQIALAVAEALRSQRPVAGEGSTAVLPHAADGAARAFRLRTTPLRDEEGRLLGAVTLLEDITRFREIDRLKSAFIATASHELRTPLTSVQMGIHLVLESAVGPLTDAQREVLTICRDDCARLETLMRDLLDLSRIEAGEAAPHLVPISATTLIQAAVAAAQPHVEGHERTLRVEVPAGLPDVLADRLQIERVLANLMSNAVRHTTRGDEIAVTVTRMRDTWRSRSRIRAVASLPSTCRASSRSLCRCPTRHPVGQDWGSPSRNSSSRRMAGRSVCAPTWGVGPRLPLPCRWPASPQVLTRQGMQTKRRRSDATCTGD